MNSSPNTAAVSGRPKSSNSVCGSGWDYNGGRNWRSRVIYDTIRVDLSLVGPDVLGQIQVRLENPAELLAQLGEYGQSSIEARFKSQFGPDGAAWQALTPRYLKRKKKNKDKVLTLDGYLRRIHWQAPPPAS